MKFQYEFNMYSQEYEVFISEGDKVVKDSIPYNSNPHSMTADALGRIRKAVDALNTNLATTLAPTP